MSLDSTSICEVCAYSTSHEYLVVQALLLQPRYHLILLQPLQPALLNQLSLLEQLILNILAHVVVRPTNHHTTQIHVQDTRLYRLLEEVLESHRFITQGLPLDLQLHHLGVLAIALQFLQLHLPQIYLQP